MNQLLLQELKNEITLFGKHVHELEHLVLTFNPGNIPNLNQLEIDMKQTFALFFRIKDEPFIKKLKVHEKLSKDATYDQFLKDLDVAKTRTYKCIEQLKKEIKTGTNHSIILVKLKEFYKEINYWDNLFNHLIFEIDKMSHSAVGDVKSFVDRHFNNITYFYSSDCSSEVIRYMAHIDRTYHSLSMLNFSHPKELEIYVLSQKDWNPPKFGCKTIRPYGIPFTDGVKYIFLPKNYPQHLPLAIEMNQLLHLLGRHELTHVFLRKSQIVLPNWKEEVVANIISYRAGEISQNMSFLKTAIAAGQNNFRGKTFRDITKGEQYQPGIVGEMGMFFAQVMIFDALSGYYSSHSFGNLLGDANNVYKILKKIKW